MVLVFWLDFFVTFCRQGKKRKKRLSLCLLPKQKNINQMGFYSTFEEQLNHNHPLYKLSLVIRWPVFDDANLSIDTTVQEKNITYPTDDKLYKKIIKKYLSIANEEGVALRQSYTQAIKKLSTIQRLRKIKMVRQRQKKQIKKLKQLPVF
jgi:hypothetical protein